MRELLARASRALLRRASAGRRPGPAAPATRRCASATACSISTSAACSAAEGAEVEISAAEFDLLALFARHPNRPLNRDQIMEQAHNRGWDVFDRSIDLRVMRLRRKIERNPDKPEVIKTVRNVGYVYVPRPGRLVTLPQPVPDAAGAACAAAYALLMLLLGAPVLAAVIYVLVLQFEIVSLGAQRQIAMSTDRRVTRLDRRALRRCATTCCACATPPVEPTIAPAVAVDPHRWRPGPTARRWTLDALPACCATARRRCCWPARGAAMRPGATRASSRPRGVRAAARLVSGSRGGSGA